MSEVGQQQFRSPHRGSSVAARARRERPPRCQPKDAWIDVGWDLNHCHFPFDRLFQCWCAPRFGAAVGHAAPGSAALCTMPSGKLLRDLPRWATIPKSIVYILLALGLRLFLPKLGMPLLDPDEGLYAAIAGEMLARGDWIVPHVNGLPYLESRRSTSGSPRWPSSWSAPRTGRPGPGRRSRRSVLCS